MNDSGVKIEVHLIQNFAPSNLNRDDTGQPKSAYFGRCRRARISSQCGKRAVREWFREHGTVSVGSRTKRLQQLIRDRLAEDIDFVQKVPDEEGRETGIRIFTEAYYAAPDKKRPENTAVLLFISPEEIDICAKTIKTLWDDETKDVSKKGKTVKETVRGIGSVVKDVLDFDAKNAPRKDDAEDRGETGVLPESEQPVDDGRAEGVESKKKADKPKIKPTDEIKERIKKVQLSGDIALFGRMLAEQPVRNTDGACQVAHPISTHRVDMEMDFYTAVDDLNPTEETGAGMMGVVGFNSACYYRYALVDRDQLARNLSCKTGRISGKWSEELTAKDYSEADKVIRAFLEAMVYAIPTGKQNSFAAQNLPSFGLFVRRKGGVPVSLANAFAAPVRPTREEDDLIGLSVDKLTRHWDALKKVYGEQGIQSTACFHLIEKEGYLNGLGGSDKGSVADAIDAVMEAPGKP